MFCHEGFGTPSLESHAFFNTDSGVSFSPLSVRSFQKRTECQQLLLPRKNAATRERWAPYRTTSRTETAPEYTLKICEESKGYQSQLWLPLVCMMGWSWTEIWNTETLSSMTTSIFRKGAKVFNLSSILDFTNAPKRDTTTVLKPIRIYHPFYIPIIVARADYL